MRGWGSREKDREREKAGWTGKGALCPAHVIVETTRSSAGTSTDTTVVASRVGEIHPRKEKVILCLYRQVLLNQSIRRGACVAAAVVDKYRTIFSTPYV